MNVLILGCGPAGLMAAHAFARNDWNVSIVSKKRQSEMFGAQYLHRPIPGISADQFMIDYRLEGTAEGYRRKIYGEGSRVNVSPETLTGFHPAWDIRLTYDRLWDMYEKYIIDGVINPTLLVKAVGKWKPDLVVSTIPAPSLCDVPEHSFSSEKVWAIGDAPERGQRCPVRVEEDTVVCNGEPSPGWYRAATVRDYSTAEWPQAKKPPLSGVAAVLKPLTTTCVCFPGVLRLGRYGRWQKGVLSHEAFVMAEEIATERKP